MEFIAKHNISFEETAAARQHDGGDHNRFIRGKYRA